MRDENNNLIGFSYNNETYYYKKNIQEDIIGIYNNKYEQIIEYEYDAWGRILSIKDGNGQEITNPSHIAHINPFRYRSYYYDEETKLYYLNSRYYNPEISRFINADSMTKAPGTSVLSTNMYAYCENNPIVNSDATGEWFGIASVFAAFVGAVVGVVSQVVTDVVSSVMSRSVKKSNYQTYIGAAVGGIVGGVATIHAGPVAGVSIGSGIATSVGQVLENATGEQNRSTAEIITNAVIDAAIGGAVTKAIPVKVSGITSDRNSMSAIYQTKITKLANGTTKTISSRVVAKSVAANVVSDITMEKDQSIFSHQYGQTRNNFKMMV